jgi:hypothetical protein
MNVDIQTGETLFLACPGREGVEDEKNLLDCRHNRNSVFVRRLCFQTGEDRFKPWVCRRLDQ